MCIAYGRIGEYGRKFCVEHLFEISVRVWGEVRRGGGWRSERGDDSSHTCN